MTSPLTQSLVALYEADEIAWLEATAELIREGRLDQVDLGTLAEYLTDMAGRDKREVKSRLGLLIAHLLKWRSQPEYRSGSWRGTIEVQRQELAELLESGVLRNHAQAVLEKAYGNGVAQAVAETRLPDSTFPEECPYSIDELLSVKLEHVEGRP